MEVVYILKDLSKNNTYKIGRSQNVHQRVGQMQTGSSGKLEYIGIFFCKNASILETKALDKFKHKKIHGEWVELNDDELEQARAYIRDTKEDINNKCKNKNAQYTQDTQHTQDIENAQNISDTTNIPDITNTLDTPDITNISPVKIYKCICGEFETSYQSNYSRHIKTCSTNIQPMLLCKYCNSPYKTNGFLNNHQQKCKNKDNYELKLESDYKSSISKLDTEYKSSINKLDTEIKLLNNTLNNKESIIEDLKVEIVELKSQLYADKKEFKEIARNANLHIFTNNISSESALKYITKNFSHAPILEKKNIPKLIEYDNSEGIEKDKLSEEWLCVEKMGSFVTTISKIIIDMYKTNDPSLQSMWMSDIERLTFYRRALNDKKVGVWVTDKKGLDISSEIIKPILDHIFDQIVAYNKKNQTIKDFSEEYIELSYNLMERLNDNQTTTNILKYCAPYFAINKIKDLAVPDIPTKHKTITIKPKKNK